MCTNKIEAPINAFADNKTLIVTLIKSEAFQINPRDVKMMVDDAMKYISIIISFGKVERESKTLRDLV